jgi:tRNA dimethylallyltransferase
LEATTGGVLIVGGATASGKTEFGIALAERYGAEIVGADSRQIYRGMATGTAAPTPAQRRRIPHHLVEFVDPYERYSAARFVTDAIAAIAAIHARGRRAIVVGGTGFYLRALCGDVRLGSHVDPVIRSRVLHESRVHPIDVLHEWLRVRDPQRAADISRRDPYRIVRALEIELGRAAKRAGEPGSGPPSARVATLRELDIPVVKVAIDCDLATLTPRIVERTTAMLRAGLIDEAERVGVDACAADAVGYREALAYQNGWLTAAELRAVLVRATRGYAKRQLTWFRSEPRITWLRAGDLRAADAAVAALGWVPIGSASRSDTGEEMPLSEPKG